jgi:hypothetical protein
MVETPQNTESILSIIEGISRQSIMLPEFQRDFRWELEQTYDLFDSLIRGIFVGTIIYGKPAFALTLRVIDTRPRKGGGSNAKIETIDLSDEQIKQRGQINGLKIVLDGQQRITSIYRAITGIDNVYVKLKNNLSFDELKNPSLEEVVEDITGEESPEHLSIKLVDAYEKHTKGLRENALLEKFHESQFYKRITGNSAEYDEIYLGALDHLLDLFKESKMLSYYLLDMSLDKFCIFFERSNSRGIQLNFTDILAAKLYHGFNLRKKIEEFESVQKIKLNREIIVRAIALISGLSKIDKSTILDKLTADDFNKYWDKVCQLYVECIDYLTMNSYIVSQGWIPSENMLIPLMMLLNEFKGFEQIGNAEKKFIEFWYWASIFANRYSSASNEVIIVDSQVLVQVARKEKIAVRGYFTKMRSLIQSADDLFSYTKKASIAYRGILNLVNFEAKGLRDWTSTGYISPIMDLEDHHIYPRAYINSNPVLEAMTSSEATQFVDSVVNRTLIPKLTNIKIGKQAPQTYLSLLEANNSELAVCLSSHLLPSEMYMDSEWNSNFKLFLEERASNIFGLIDKYAIVPLNEMIERYGSGYELDSMEVNTSPKKSRLQDMIDDGRINIGDEVYVRKQPNNFAKIINGEMVEYKGRKLTINKWGQEMTGWSSINIYDSILMRSTNQPIRSLR